MSGWIRKNTVEPIATKHGDSLVCSKWPQIVSFSRVDSHSLKSLMMF
jgi:hypothetical protein